jgi:hypothetical protein
MRIGKSLLVIAVLVALVGMTCSASADFGPLQVQNRFPLFLMFLTPRPVSALPPGQGVLNAALAIDYSSVYVNESSSQWRILMDMETTVGDLSFAYGITDRVAVRLNIPLVNMSGGFLDGFLKSYHDALGVGDYGRENRPQNSFAYQINKGGAAWIEADSGGLRLADMTLSAQWALLSESSGSPWHVSLLTSLKLPTGDARQGYGSGRMDAGFFLPAQYESGPWSVYAMPGVLLHSDPETAGADVSARDGISLFIGAGYAYSERWQWLAQLNYFSSPVEKTGIGKLDDGAIELELGFRRILNPDWHIEFAFCEDIFTRSAPDFTVHLGLVRSFSGLKL